MIEKLGIRKSKIGKSGAFNFTKCLVDINDGGSICHFTDWQDVDIQINVMKAAPEMLEALIEDCLSFSKGLETDNIPPFGKPYEVYLKRINIIEKATGKTWEEIKELTK